MPSEGCDPVGGGVLRYISVGGGVGIRPNF